MHLEKILEFISRNLCGPFSNLHRHIYQHCQNIVSKTSVLDCCFCFVNIFHSLQYFEKIVKTVGKKILTNPMIHKRFKEPWIRAWENTVYSSYAIFFYCYFEGNSVFWCRILNFSFPLLKRRRYTFMLAAIFIIMI